METIGKRILSLRTENGMSQEKVAELIGKKKSNISGYENDKFEPSAQTIVEICKLFKVSADWLLFGDENIFVPKLEHTPGEEFTPKDIELLAKLHQLSERDQGKIEGTIDGLLMTYDDNQRDGAVTSSRSTNGNKREEAATKSESA